MVLFLSFVMCMVILSNAQLVPPTQGNLKLNFWLESSSGSSPAVTWSLTNNTGTLKLQGKTYDAVAYAFQQWGSDLALIDVIGISTDSTDLAVIYLYCNTADSIYDVYTESFNILMSSQSASGQASYQSTSPITVNVNLPSIKSMPPSRKNGITITSSNNDLVYYGGQGYAVSSSTSTNYSITTFNVVDCSNCGQGGWYELHSFFYANPVGCFGILYLEFPSPNTVLLDWGMCFGSNAQLWQDQWTASWSGNLNQKGLLKN